jgi:hypothetical protein
MDRIRNAQIPRHGRPVAPQPSASIREWLVDRLVTAGLAVARKLRGPPRSPMVRLHPK